MVTLNNGQMQHHLDILVTVDATEEAHQKTRSASCYPSNRRDHTELLGSQVNREVVTTGKHGVGEQESQGQYEPEVAEVVLGHHR